MFLIGHLKTRHLLVLMKFHMTVLYELRALFFSMIKPEKHPGMLGITTRTEKAVKSNEHFLIAFCFSLSHCFTQKWTHVLEKCSNLTPKFAFLA